MGRITGRGFAMPTATSQMVCHGCNETGHMVTKEQPSWQLNPLELHSGAPSTRPQLTHTKSAASVEASNREPPKLPRTPEALQHCRPDASEPVHFGWWRSSSFANRVLLLEWRNRNHSSHVLLLKIGGRKRKQIIHTEKFHRRGDRSPDRGTQSRIRRASSVTNMSSHELFCDYSCSTAFDVSFFCG